MGRFKRLSKIFFLRHPSQVAPRLLGRYLVLRVRNRRIVSRIVETEAYGGREDKGCHVGRFGCTKRTAQLFGEAGLAYVYSVFINTYCLNVVSHRKDDAGGVLIRALEPLSGIEWVCGNLKVRKKDCDKAKLLNGPGKLCKALRIDRTLNGEDLLSGRKVYLTEGEKVSAGDVSATSRINIPYAGKSKDLPWRFIIKDSGFLSRKRPSG